ncbi:hypothetical protein BpHYR1_026001 [Brachionus plicatilis]|uniref:Uncharacterized protein n=1 Tax=Brachionus plicatilis TaxID=10195 RepID=A0A3M7RQX9_BRAPC|nr:hypothetical protein BpHYR1_026001 [Brachionus plicatilis]
MVTRDFLKLNFTSSFCINMPWLKCISKRLPIIETILMVASSQVVCLGKLAYPFKMNQETAELLSIRFII